MKSRNQKGRFTCARATNFYYSFVFLPPQKRRAIEAVYAFARRGDDAVDGRLSPGEAARAIEQCCRDLDACYDGRAAKVFDPVTQPELAGLAEAVARFRIPRQPFDDLLLGLEMDLGVTRYETFDDLAIYCYRVASTIGLIAIEIFGYRNPGARDYAVHLGTALQLVNILRDLRADAERGRIYLPLEDLRRFGVDTAGFRDGKPGARFAELVEFEAGRARSYFDLARRALPSEDRRSLLPAEIMAATYWRLLGRIRRRGKNVLEERVRLSRPLKFWTALSVYLGAEWWK